MSLYQRVLSEQRALLALVALILLIDIALYAFAVYPWSNKLAASERRMASASSQLTAVTDAFSAVSEANLSKSLANNQLERFYGEVLPGDLAEARGLFSPYFHNLAEETNLVLERRTSVAEKEEDSSLASLHSTMVLAGDYEDIREFIYRLETAPEFILIESVVLGQGNGSDNDLVLTLGVSTYYRERSDEGA
jgi:Tfp pilus assembly protein PilO